MNNPFPIDIAPFGTPPNNPFPLEPECSAKADFEGQVEEDEAAEECRGESQEYGPSDDVVRVIFVVYRTLRRQAVDVIQKELQD